MNTYAVTNQKGGVGKTTVTVNVADAVNEAGSRPLIIDADPRRVTVGLNGPYYLETATEAEKRYS